MVHNAHNLWVEGDYYGASGSIYNEQYNNSRLGVRPVIVIEKSSEELDYDSLLSETLELIDLGVKPNDSLNYISKKYNASKNLLYNMLEERKK